MAKGKGNLSAIYMQTSAASVTQSAIAMSRVGTTMWWRPTDPLKQYFDIAHTITVKDGGTTITTVQEISYAGGYVRLLTVPAGAVTVDAYVFACALVGGFNAHSIDRNMALVECSCYEDDNNDVYEPTQFSASGQASGFHTTVDAILTMAKGNNKDLTLISKILGDGPGHDGVSAASFEIVVAGNNTALSVVVTVAAIVVNSATGVAGAATSTARDILDALNANTDAMALVKAKLATGSDGSGIPGALAHTHLAGGVNPAAFDKFGQDLIGVFYWDKGAALARTEGLVTFEKVSLKGGVKSLIEKTINFKVQGPLYEHNA
jgi:hypothetical protein